MQELSFAVHIPLVCFGIACPAFVLVAEWLYRPTISFSGWGDRWLASLE